MVQGPLQTDYQRYRSGDSQPVVSPAVEEDIVIRIGDLVYLDSGSPKPASEIAIGGAGEPATLEEAQEFLHDNFLGVAAQRSPDGVDNPIRVNTTAIHEFTVVEGDYEVGDYLGPNWNDDEDALTNVLVAVSGPNLAIGRAAEKKEGATYILVDIISTVMKGGAQNPA